jgi:putative SOS response-associated peptidase YedK
MKDDLLFASAGIRDRWKSAQGTTVENCAILTTAPNELFRDVHDRRPAILKPEIYREWASHASFRRALMHLLMPFEAAMMKWFPVNSAMNDPQDDTPHCIQEMPEFTSAQTMLLSNG